MKKVLSVFISLFMICAVFTGCNGAKDYGTLNIRDIENLPVGGTQEIEAVFSDERYASEISYSFAGNAVSIENGKVTANERGRSVIVMARTQYHTTSFRVSTSLSYADYGTLEIADIELEEEDSIEIEAVFSIPARSEAINYSFAGNTIKIERGIITALTAGQNVTVTAKTAHHETSFVVRTVRSTKPLKRTVYTYTDYSATPLPRLLDEGDGDVTFGGYEADELIVDKENFTVKGLKVGTYTVVATAGKYSVEYTVVVKSLGIWEDETLKILMIGNSFTNDTRQWAWSIADGIGIERVKIAVLNVDGIGLAEHIRNAKNDSAIYNYYENTEGSWTTQKQIKLSEGISLDDWDFVTFHGTSWRAGVASEYANLDWFADFIKGRLQNAEHTKIVWLMTWAYQSDSTHQEFYRFGKNQMTMYHSIVSATQSKVVPLDEIDMIAPLGTAIQNMRTSFVGDTLTRDGYHLSYALGRYVSGLMLIKYLTALPIDGLTYMPAGVSAAERAAAIEAVNNAFENPWQITESKLKESI